MLYYFNITHIQALCFLFVYFAKDEANKYAKLIKANNQSAKKFFYFSLSYIANNVEKHS